MDPRRRIDRTANYLIILGLASLLLFNLGGFLLIWWGSGIAGRSRTSRLWVLWVHGILSALCLFFLAALLVAGWHSPTVRVLWWTFRSPPPWLMAAVLLGCFVLYLLPVIWLLTPAVREESKLWTKAGDPPQAPPSTGAPPARGTDAPTSRSPGEGHGSLAP